MIRLSKGTEVVDSHKRVLWRAAGESSVHTHPRTRIKSKFHQFISKFNQQPMDQTKSMPYFFFSIICYTMPQYRRKDQSLLQFHGSVAVMLFCFFQESNFIKNQMCKNTFFFFLSHQTCKLRYNKPVNTTCVMPLVVLVSLTMCLCTMQTFRQKKYMKVQCKLCNTQQRVHVARLY